VFIIAIGISIMISFSPTVSPHHITNSPEILLTIDDDDNNRRRIVFMYFTRATEEG